MGVLQDFSKCRARFVTGRSLPYTGRSFVLTRVRSSLAVPESERDVSDRRDRRDRRELDRARVADRGFASSRRPSP